MSPWPKPQNPLSQTTSPPTLAATIHVAAIFKHNVQNVYVGLAGGTALQLKPFFVNL